MLGGFYVNQRILKLLFTIDVGMRILIVEDEHKIANAIKRGLGRQGYALRMHGRQQGLSGRGSLMRFARGGFLRGAAA